MKATINEIGRLLLIPENALERYALHMWLREYNETGALDVFIEPVQHKEVRKEKD